MMSIKTESFTSSQSYLRLNGLYVSLCLKNLNMEKQ